MSYGQESNTYNNSTSQGYWSGSYLNYMYRGPAFAAGAFKRENYPEDVVTPNGPSSYRYRGDITNDYFKQMRFIRIIDGVVTYDTVPPALRQEAVSKLDSMETKSNIQGALSGIGCAGSIYKAFNSAANVNIWGVAAVALGVISAFSFGRGYQAGVEGAKWVDQVERIKEQRVVGGLDFRTLEKSDLRAGIFTSAERAHVYHRTIRKLDKEWDITLSSGNPAQVDAFMHKFMLERSPFLEHSLRYAHKDFESAVLFDPKSPTKGMWSKDSLLSATNYFRKMSEEYIQWKARLASELEEIKRNETAMAATAKATSNLVSDGVNRSAKSSVTKQKAERDAELKIVRNKFHRFQIDSGTLAQEERRIKDAYMNDPVVKKAKSEKKANQATVNTVTSIAQAGVALYSEFQRQQTRDAANERLRNQKIKELSELFGYYKKTRHTSTDFNMQNPKA